MKIDDIQKNNLYLNINIPDDEFDTMEFRPLMSSVDLLLADKSTSIMKQFLDKTDEAHLKLYKQKSDDNTLAYYRNKALIEKYLLPVYFPKDYSMREIFEEVQIREYLITSQMTLKEAEKKAKKDKCKDVKTFEMLLQANLAMWPLIKIYRLLTPFKWYYYHRLEEIIETHQEITKDDIQLEWDNLPYDEKKNALDQATQENIVRRDYTLVHNISNLILNPPKTYIEIYINELELTNLENQSIKIDSKEVEESFKMITNMEKMQYIREAHKEELIYNYIKDATTKHNNKNEQNKEKPKKKKRNTKKST